MENEFDSRENEFQPYDDDYQLVPEDERITYKDSTYEIVSKIAYLIGVPYRIFENEFESPQMEVYERLNADKTARIVRHLCIIRTAIERNYRRINEKMRMEYCSILSCPEYIPDESINQLSMDGVDFVKKSSIRLSQHIVELNKLITDRINNCKKLFPIWIKWDYVREIFLMPDGLKEEGTKEAADVYYENMGMYPYKMYINWQPQENGNILYNDKKFVTLLYQWHNDYFADYSKVSDAGSFTKENIYQFIDDSNKLVVVVDCENSDPYKLCATLKNLDSRYTEKISSIILFDDIHTSSAWEILDEFTSIPVEHMLIERVKENKSLVDIKLTAGACQEHYQNHVDSFIIVSSDSDYWGLISTLLDAEFLVMIERDSCGPDLKNALINAGIFYCYIDDFYSGNSEEIRRGAMFRAMREYIAEKVQLNIYDMFDAALTKTRIEMNDAEKNQFVSKYLKTINMSISPEGDINLTFKRK